MSALLDRPRLTAAARPSRPAGRPTLRVVTAPQPARRMLPYIVGLIAILLASMMGALLLNTSMAQTAFEIQSQQVELENLRQREASLRAEVEGAASPGGLQEAATDLGMVPAESVEHLSLVERSVREKPAR